MFCICFPLPTYIYKTYNEIPTTRYLILCLLCCLWLLFFMFTSPAPNDLLWLHIIRNAVIKVASLISLGLRAKWQTLLLINANAYLVMLKSNHRLLLFKILMLLLIPISYRCNLFCLYIILLSTVLHEMIFYPKSAYCNFYSKISTYVLLLIMMTYQSNPS